MKSRKELFQCISDIQLSAVMFHGQMMEYFQFIGLHGFKRFHEYRMKKELCERVKLRSYFLKHYGELLCEDGRTAERREVIPDDWKRYRSKDVTKTIVRQATQKAIKEYIEWESYAKEQYEEYAKELLELDCINDYEYVACLIRDTAYELQKAEKMSVKLNGVDYDMLYIQDIQKEMHDRCKKKMGLK